jgi:hypothetical protein
MTSTKDNKIIMRTGAILAGLVYLVLNIGSAGAFTLSGTVTDIQPSPVDQVAVQMYINGIPIGGAGDTTDFSGFYSISGLTATTYEISFTPDPLYNLQSRLITNFDMQGDTVLDVTLFPENHYYIEGFVTDTLGNGLPEIDLNIYDQVADTLIAVTGDDTDEFGYYDVLVPAGLYRILYRPIAGQPFVPVQLFNVEIVADTTIDVELPGGYYIQGTVTGPNGPVVNADMDADDSFTGERIYTVGDDTDGNGQYQIVVPPGTYDINVTPQIFDRIVPEIQYGIVVNNNIVLNFNLVAGSILSGTVERSGGSGVPGVDIDVFHYSNGIKLFTPDDNTDQLGFFQIVLPHGNFNIEVEPPASLRLASAYYENFAFNGDNSIAAVLDTAMYVTGTVIDSVGGPVPFVSVNSHTSSGGVYVFAPGNKTDSTGFYDILIPPDTYDLIYRPDSLLGLLDSAVYLNVPVFSDTTINVILGSAEPDTVPPVVSVISPNGGESWAAYTTHSIVWNASDNLGVTYVDIFLSLVGQGGPFSLVSGGETNDGTYLWTIPADTSDNSYIKIVAYDYSSNTGDDLSNAPFTIYSSPSNCDYVIGDINDSGNTNGLDVVFMVNYFKGGDPPPYVCQCTPGNSWHVAGDVNGSCNFNGLDVTYLVGYFKGGPALAPCSNCPPN